MPTRNFGFSRLVHSEGLTPSQLRRVRELVDQHGPLFLERWNEYFGRS